MIVTDVCWINTEKPDIETVLESKFGEIIRWAIVAAEKNSYKVTVSYIKKDRS